MDKNKSKCNFISFGKCYKKYFLLFLGLLISNIIFDILIYLLMRYDTYTGNNFINFMSYLFFISLCESMMIIPYLILKKNISSKKVDVSLKKEQNNNIEKYIFNKITIQFSKRDKIYIIIFGILNLILDIAYTFSIFFGNSNSNKSLQIYITNYSFNFEFIFLFLVSKFLYNTKFYRHQNISIVVLILILLGKLILLFYGVKIGKLFSLLLFYIIYSFLKSFWICYIKGLMEYKYFSPYKVCSIFGLFNLTILTPAFFYYVFYFL